MPRTRLLFGCVLLLLLFVSCKPRNVLSRKELADVLYDLHMTEAALNRNGLPVPTDWTHGLQSEFFKDLSYAAVLRKHELSQADFYNSIAWYSKHLNQYSKVYMLVESKIDAFLTDVQFGRFNALKDTSMLQSIDKVVKYHWGFVKQYPTMQDGIAAQPLDSVLTFARWFKPIFDRPMSNDSALVHRMVARSAVVDSSSSAMDTTPKPQVEIRTGKVEDSPTKNNVVYPKNSHFVDFEPAPRKPVARKRAGGRPSDDQIRERFRERAKEVPQN